MVASVPQSAVSRKLGLLREVDLFRGLSDADIEAIGQATTMRSCPRATVILSPGEALELLHIVKEGRVRVYRITPDGKQLSLDIYDKGVILGDMAWLGQRRVAEAYAETVGDAVICTITPDELRRLIERYPLIGLNIIGHLSARLQEAERELESMAYEPVGQRLARRLVDLAARYGVPGPAGHMVISERFTQQELAELVGTTRETLAHVLADLRRRGILDTRDHELAIRDIAELTRISSGEALESSEAFEG